MKKRTVPQDGLNLTKLKRILRPLISKIHVLNDLNAKYPRIFELNYEPQEPQPHLKRPKLQDPDDDYRDYKTDFKINKRSRSPPVDPDFSHPENSHKRLESYKPYIADDVYRAYNEIFHTFQSIIRTVYGEKEPDAKPVPKLSRLCGLKLGKFVALSTKSTYYKTSQTSLFDQKAIPKGLRHSSRDLWDDIDRGFEFEPVSITQRYHKYIFLGYLVHLLVFHSNRIMYLLIPVLVQWLDEESGGSGMLKTVSRTLFHEFWAYDSRYSETIDRQAIQTLNGNDSANHSSDSFKRLHMSGWWENFIRQVGIVSFRGHSYDSIFLDTLAVNRKLPCHEMDPALTSNVYTIIRRNPQHPNNNSVLVSLMAQIMWHTRSNAGSTINSALNHFQKSYQYITEFLHVWLSFGHDDKSMVYNSLYPGNDNIFEAVKQLCSFVVTKVLKIMSVLDHHIDNTEAEDEITRLQTISDQFKQIYVDTDCLRISTELLSQFFLDLVTSRPSMAHHTQSQISRSLVIIQKGDDLSTRDNRNLGLDEFLLWLAEDPSWAPVARLFSTAYYARDWK